MDLKFDAFLKLLRGIVVTFSYIDTWEWKINLSFILNYKPCGLKNPVIQKTFGLPLLHQVLN